MNKCYKLFILILIFIFVGCTKNDEYEKEEIVVKNTNTINYIKNNIVSMQSIDKTLEIYKNGSGTKEDYSDTDKLLFGLNYVFASKVLNNAPKLPNIDGIISGIDVYTSISNLFDSEVIYDTIGTCPNYIYNRNANVFYIKYNCTTDSNISIITYIDKITLENDHYYANVYVGIIDNITNKVYGNIERTRYIETVSNGESYNINDDNKNNFESYTYTFLKKSNDKYIFDSIKKNF